MYARDIACVAGGMRERASGGGAANFPRGRSPRVNSRAAKPRTRLFTNPLTAEPLAFTASQPNQKHSRTKIPPATQATRDMVTCTGHIGIHEWADGRTNVDDVMAIKPNFLTSMG